MAPVKGETVGVALPSSEVEEETPTVQGLLLPSMPVAPPRLVPLGRFPPRFHIFTEPAQQEPVGPPALGQTGQQRVAGFKVGAGRPRREIVDQFASCRFGERDHQRGDPVGHGRRLASQKQPQPLDSRPLLSLVEVEPDEAAEQVRIRTHPLRSEVVKQLSSAWRFCSK